MEPWFPKSARFGELLGELRVHPKLRFPILLEAVGGTSFSHLEGSTMDQTLLELPSKSWPIEPLQYAKHRFRVIAPPDGVAEMSAKVSIGRSRKCDIKVEEDSVSKHHATFNLDLQRNRTLLVDEASLNGTFVNDLQLVPNEGHLLRTGDRVAFGQLMFVFMDPATLTLMAKDPIAIGFMAGDEPSGSGG